VVGFEFVGRESAPNTELLPGSDGVVPASDQQWTICTRGFGRLDSLFSDYPIWQVFGEERLGDPLTGHFSHPFDG
jgi:hypothetical protein